MSIKSSKKISFIFKYSKNVICILTNLAKLVLESQIVGKVGVIWYEILEKTDCILKYSEK